MKKNITRERVKTIMREAVKYFNKNSRGNVFVYNAPINFSPKLIGELSESVKEHGFTGFGLDFVLNQIKITK